MTKRRNKHTAHKKKNHTRRAAFAAVTGIACLCRLGGGTHGTAAIEGHVKEARVENRTILICRSPENVSDAG